MIPATIWKSNFRNCDDRSDRIFSAITTILAIVTIVNDHMETRLLLAIPVIVNDHQRSYGNQALQKMALDVYFKIQIENFSRRHVLCASNIQCAEHDMARFQLEECLPAPKQ